MNLVTLTIDLDTHAAVPREATLTMAVAGKMEANRHNQGNEQMECVYKHMLAAAPPYQSEQDLNMVWIPVSQRIPDDNDLVLTIDKNGVQLVAFHDENMWVTSFDDGLEITHWMPLPSAPKGDIP